MFAQVVAGAAEAGGTVTYENGAEEETKDLVLRGAPGVLHSADRRFTHALIRFGSARPLKVHLRVKVHGKTMDAESDVLVIDTKAAPASRDKTSCRPQLGAY